MLNAFKLEDLVTATRARARMHQTIDREVAAGTFTIERYAQLYTELQQQIQGLDLPPWFINQAWRAYLITSALFDQFVDDTRASLERRGVTTDEQVEQAVREITRFY